MEKSLGLGAEGGRGGGSEAHAQVDSLPQVPGRTIGLRTGYSQLQPATANFSQPTASLQPNALVLRRGLRMKAPIG